jgi:hypothetical protein
LDPPELNQESIVTECLLQDCEPESLMKNYSFLAEKALAFNQPGSTPRLVEKAAKYVHTPSGSFMIFPNNN